jgi:LuxR family maltose regulon positive regulatory protein
LGRLEEVSQALDAAEASGHADPQLDVLRALHTWKAGNVGLATALLDEVPFAEDDLFVLTVHRLLQGVTAFWSGDLSRAERQLTKAARAAEDDANLLGHIYARGYLALLGVQRNDPDATALVDEAGRLVQDTLSDEHFVAMIPALARARLLMGGNDAAGVTASALAAVELARRGAGRVELAAALLTAARAARTWAGGESTDGALHAEARALLRDCSDPGPLVGSWLSTEERTRRPALEKASGSLTERELDILRLLPTQMSQRELASALFLAPNTVKTHMRAIYRKLGADSRGEAVLRARTQGLLEPGHDR